MCEQERERELDFKIYKETERERERDTKRDALGSISSTLNARVFHTNVVLAAFL